MSVSNLSTGLRPGVCLSTTRPTVPYEGQMIYETDTDMVAIWNGSAWRYLAATTPTNGTVLQVAYGSTLTEVAIGSGSFSSIGLTASITPKSTSSKILVQASIQYRIRDANATACAVSIVRNSTTVYADGNGYAMGYSYNSSGSSGRAFLQFLDSPSSTSSTTYTIHGRSFGSGIVDFQDDNMYVSTITLMEIAG